MSTNNVVPVDYAPKPEDQHTGDFLGHPKGLFVLFTTEMWERFSFYTMRGILTLYLVKIVLFKMTQSQGEEAAGGMADQIYGAYLGFVYAATFIGGKLADRLIGQRRAIYIGGMLMSLAHFTLMTHSLLNRPGAEAQPGQYNLMFYLGLSLLAAGNGFFKPNISTIVGTLYTQEDRRRDSAFTLFYMGINIGATFASLGSGLGQSRGWYLAYGLAGTGMIVSLLVLGFGTKHLQGKGLPPAGASLSAQGPFGLPNGVLMWLGVLVFLPIAGSLMWKPGYAQYLSYLVCAVVFPYLIWETVRGQGEEVGRMSVIIVLCVFSMIFWGFFELQGSTITRFINDRVNCTLFGMKLEPAFVANVVNPALVILLSIPFSWFWIWLDKKGLEPSSPFKFSLGLMQLALGFLCFWMGFKEAGATGRCGLMWPVVGYLIFSTGELCLSPVGLSMITKLSPARLVGVFMGTWFLVSGMANVLTGGFIGAYTAKHTFGETFVLIAAICGASSLVLLFLTPVLKKNMGGLK